MMRSLVHASPILMMAAVLWPSGAMAQDAGAAQAPKAPAAAAHTGPTHPAAAQAPAKVQGPKPRAKPHAKPKVPSKAIAIKKKPRAPGPPHEPDPAVRRAIAGAPARTERTAAENPEVSALREADRELFGPPSSSLPMRSADAMPAPATDGDRPAVFATGLPPPVGPGASSEAARADAAWIASLAQPDLPIRWNARVVRYLNYYRSDPRGRSVASSWYKKSGAFDGLIRHALRANGLPEDLVWVALVESGFNPLAYSPAGAAGLWQFMPATARLYGLVVDRWVDERLDPERSTEAGAKFLSDLHQRFGTWELALASYNMGFGGVLTAVRKYNTNDFWELSRFEAGLPWETTLYVPKIAALAIVARNPAVFGLDGLVRDASIAFETVQVPPGVPLSTVASAAGVDAEQVEQLNPQFLLSRTPPRARSGQAMWAVRVPPGGAARYASNIVRVRAHEPPIERYVVRYGDSLPDIARAHSVNLTQLASINSLDADDVPQPGAVLLIPPAAAGDLPGDKPLVVVAADLQPPPGYRRVFYRVLGGDTLSAVSEAFGVSVDDLRRWNLLDPSARLQESMTLMMMVPLSRDLTGLTAKGDDQVRVLVVGTDGFFEHHEALRDRVRTTVVVRAGDNWKKIAERTGLSVAQLERINRRSRHTQLEAGERLIAYVPANTISRGSTVPAVHVIESQQPAPPPRPEDLPELPAPPATAPQAHAPSAPGA